MQLSPFHNKIQPWDFVAGGITLSLCPYLLHVLPIDLETSLWAAAALVAGGVFLRRKLLKLRPSVKESRRRTIALITVFIATVGCGACAAMAGCTLIDADDSGGPAFSMFEDDEDHSCSAAQHAVRTCEGLSGETLRGRPCFKDPAAYKRYEVRIAKLCEKEWKNEFAAQERRRQESAATVREELAQNGAINGVFVLLLLIGGIVEARSGR
jgi:hypothetical protein